MTIEPTTAPWLRIAHTITAEVPADGVTAATLAAFLTIVPDHAEIGLGDTEHQPTRTIYATWPHAHEDDAMHGRDCAQHPDRFDIGQDIRQNGALYGIEAADDSTQLEGCESLWNDRPCIRTKGHHDGPTYTPHVYQAAAAGGDLYSRTADQ